MEEFSKGALTVSGSIFTYSVRISVTELLYEFEGANSSNVMVMLRIIVKCTYYNTRKLCYSKDDRAMRAI